MQIITYIVSLDADGAVCAEEITNSLTWPATTIGNSLTQFCLQSLGEILCTACIIEAFVYVIRVCKKRLCI